MFGWTVKCTCFGFSLVLSLQTANSQGSGDPTNPLMGSVGIHDPSRVIKHKDTYFVYSTGGGAKTSKDRITWTGNNDASPIRGAGGVGTLEWWRDHIEPPNNPSIWAPGISYVDGVYYVYYSVSAWYNFNSCIGLATNTTLDPNDPEYEWVDRGVVVDAETGASVEGTLNGGLVNVIDPSTFLDDDGRWYLLFGSFQDGVRMIELDRSTGMPISNPPKLIAITDHLGEASFAIKVNDYYYYTVSRGGCCNRMSSTYQVVYGRATSIQGPYENKNGQSFLESNYSVLLTRDYAPNGSVLHAGMGGQSFFWDNDSLFMVYHAYTAPEGNSLLNIKPVYLDEDDWLTLDPEEGTVITRETSSVRGTLLSNKNRGHKIYLLGVGLNRGSETRNGLYSITGERFVGSNEARLTPGLYLEPNSIRLGGLD